MLSLISLDVLLLVCDILCGGFVQLEIETVSLRVLLVLPCTTRLMFLKVSQYPNFLSNTW